MDPNLALFLLIMGMLALIAVSVKLSMRMAKKTTCQIVESFREQGAMGWEKARSLEELGVIEPWRFRFTRDYRPWALQALIQAEIVRTLGDGKFFLSETDWQRTNLAQQCAA